MQINYVNIALLYFEKQKIEEIFNSYNTRLTTINDNMKSLLNDINEFKIIDDTIDKLLKLIDLVSKDNNNIAIISNEIKIKCNDINATNEIINKIVNTDSNDFNIIKSVCVDKLSDIDKTIIEGDLFYTSDNLKKNKKKKTTKIKKEN
jgi:hypothetical protein